MSVCDKAIDLRVHPEDPCMHSFEPIPSMVFRHTANARERSRNTNVNIAFSALRTCIPTEPRDRKLSKVETLRLAISYIEHLNNVVRARAAGDYGGEVCQRYGSVMKEEETSSTLKSICTFCLTTNKRNYHLCTGSQWDNIAVPSTKRKPTFLRQRALSTTNIYSYDLYNQFVAKEVQKETQKYSQCVVKKEYINGNISMR